jgi:hypothetical protein
MDVRNLLASSLGVRGEGPNQELAARIVGARDKKAVSDLITLLSEKNKDIQSDCIKVLYEIGERKPEMVAPYNKVFLELLGHKDNRMQWGAMTALDAITSEIPDIIYQALPAILKVADKGSAITRDHAVSILIRLCSVKSYATKVFPLLMEQLVSSPANQLPMYAEKAVPVIHDGNKQIFVTILTSRLKDMEKESRRKRLEKIIRKLIN